MQKQSDNSAALSNRENQVLLLAAEGLPDRDIAERLGIAMGTVRSYWQRMRTKFNANRRGQVISLALSAAYKEANEQAMQANRWLSILVDAADEYAIFQLDSDGIIASWNPGVAKVLGYEEREFIGKHVEIIYRPEDVARGIPEQERRQALKAGKTPEHRWHVRADGKHIWTTGELVAVGEDGSTGFAKIMRDETRMLELEQEVERLREKFGAAKGT